MNELRGYSKYLGHALVIFACLIILFPFAWIFLNSIKNQVDIYSGTLRFTPTLGNFEELLFSKRAAFLKNLKNSVVVAILSTSILIVVSTLAAHALSRFKWPKLIPPIFMGGVLFLHMIPRITLVGPWYLMFRRIGLYDNLFGLSILHVVLNLPMSIWLMYTFVSEVPKELEEAAFVDGCRRAQVFVRVIVPVVVPGLVAAGILSFIFSWNEFPVALNLTMARTATIPVAVARLAQQYEVLHGQMAASAILATIPAIVLMFLGQRFIVKGLTLGALK